MPMLTVPGNLQLHYHLDDFSDPWDKKTPILLQHGNGRSGEFWYRWVPALAEKYAVIRPDMRGLGKSSAINDPGRQLRVEALVDDILRLLDHLHIPKVHFCGESMGGILGMALAAQHPDRVESLTLVAAPVFIETKMKQRYSLGFGSRIEAMEQLGIRKWVAETTKITRLSQEENPSLFEWYVDEFSKGDAATQIAMSKIVNAANAKDFLPKIHVPVLGLYPTSGQITSEQQIGLLHQGLADFRIWHAPTRFHMIHLSHPDFCTTKLLEFLDQF